MITREKIIDKIQKIPESYLLEIYEFIKRFETSKKKNKSNLSLMSKLRHIKISAPANFSQTADIVVNEEKTHE